MRNGQSTESSPKTGNRLSGKGVKIRFAPAGLGLVRVGKANGRATAFSLIHSLPAVNATHSSQVPADEVKKGDKESRHQLIGTIKKKNWLTQSNPCFFE